jgi:phenylacetate-CoA ligase
MIAREFLYWQMLLRNQRLDPSSLRRIQLKKLKMILRHSYETVPFYHRKFDVAGIKPDDINSLDDLKRVPITTKSEILSSPPQDTISMEYESTKPIWRTTSGSTGMPLRIALNGKTADFESAVWRRALSENGVRLNDRISVISDPRSFPKKGKFLEDFGLLKRQYISLFDPAESQLENLERYRPQVIKGYPSSLIILADFQEDLKINLKPNLIITTAELLDKENRKLISSAFQAELIDNYACEEFSLLAWECHEHAGYHMNVDSIIMEFVKDGRNVAPGERGEILCTSLINETMPLIRYRMEDIGIQVEDRCPCGRSLPLMKMVEGRTDDFLMSTDGRIIPPTVFFPFPFKDYDEIRQFRVIQEKIDNLSIQIVPRGNFQNSSMIVNDALGNIRGLFGERMQVNFEIVEEIERDPSGKVRKIISRIPTQDYTWKHPTR